MISYRDHEIHAIAFTPVDYIIPGFSSHAGIADLRTISTPTTAASSSDVATKLATITVALSDLRIGHKALTFNKRRLVSDFSSKGPFALVILQGSLLVFAVHGPHRANAGDLVIQNSSTYHLILRDQIDQPFRALLLTLEEKILCPLIQ